MSRYVNPVPQYYLNDGSVASSGKLYFYANKDPNTKKDTFSDELETIKNTNPVLLDGEGRCPPIFGSGRYTVVLKSNKNIQQWSRDDVDLTSLQGQFAEWSAIISYNIGDIVQASDSNYYSSLSNNNLGNDPLISPNLWEQIAYTTFWNSSATYEEDDLVIFDGNLYRSVIDGNLGSQPDSSATNVWADTAQPREWIPTREYFFGDLVVHNAAIWSSEINNNNESEPGSFFNSDWRNISAVGSVEVLTGASSTIVSGFNGTYYWNDAGGHELTIGDADSDEGATETIIVCDPGSPSNITLKRDFSIGVALFWSFSEISSWVGQNDSYEIKPGETLRLVSLGQNFYIVYADNGISEIVDLGGDFDASQEARISRNGNIVSISTIGSLTHSLGSTINSGTVIPSIYRPGNSVSNIYDMSRTADEDRISNIVIDPSGVVRLIYMDWSGVLTSETDSGGVASISYDVNNS